MLSRRDFLKLSGASLASILAGASMAYGERKSPRKNSLPDYESTGVRLLRDSTPAADGFSFPAEWRPHESTVIAMPPAQNWDGFKMDEVRKAWAAVANAIADFEPVIMAVHPDDESKVQPLLSSSIQIVALPINDGWSRDSGPIVLINGQGERRAVGFTFNGWGRKYKPYADDALFKARLCRHLNIPMYPVDLVVEGGAITTDGEGTLITTEQCLLNKNRNPGKTREEVEALLKQSLHVRKIVWLGKGTVSDPVTDGHVDGLCAFAAPGVVLLNMIDDRSDPNYGICRDARKRLQGSTDAQGRKFTIVEIPMISDVLHINFYLAHGAVIVPIANDPGQDDRPMAVLRAAFPGRKVVGVDGRILAKGGGGVHCITQQIPKMA